MSKFRWGILGTGSIAHKFAQDLKKNPKAVLYSVHSRTYDKALSFAKKYGFQRNHRNFSDFVEDDKLDIVYIATPNHLHCEQAVRCMEEGNHVLIEKPMALNAAEGRQIISVAKDTQRFCMEAMWSRFLPVYQEVNRMLRENALGDIKLVSAELGQPMKYHPDRFRFSLETGGGSLMDLGVYPISLILMLLGKPERVEGICRKGESGIDMTERLTFYYQNGTMADIRSSFECRLSNNIWIAGDMGAVEIPAPIYRPDRFYLEEYSSNKVLNSDGGLSTTLRNFLDTLGDRMHPLFKTDSKMESLPYKGNGYGYEAEEVMKGIVNGEIESQVMSWQGTIDVLEITDRLRRRWGIKFPTADSWELNS